MTGETYCWWSITTIDKHGHFTMEVAQTTRNFLSKPEMMEFVKPGGGAIAAAKLGWMTEKEFYGE